MSVGKHRVVAVSILAVGTLTLLAWGRSMAHDPVGIQSVRDRLRGAWVATKVEAGGKQKAEVDAAATRVEFAGKEVAFRSLIEGGDAHGTYFVDPAAKPAKIDFKLDAGWVVGVYRLSADELTLCVNPLALPERLGVPTRYRPRQLGAGKDHHRYVFRKATP